MKKIKPLFLQVTNHIVFFPEEVQYFASDDGQQFRAINSLKNQYPLSPKSKINDIQYFTYTGPLQTFRYLKVIADFLPPFHYMSNYWSLQLLLYLVVILVFIMRIRGHKLQGAKLKLA